MNKYHEKIVQEIALSKKTNTIPQAILLSGPLHEKPGLVIQQWVALLLCEAEDGPCGYCRQCKLYAENTHPDVVEVANENYNDIIKVENIRELQQSLFISPQLACRRIVVMMHIERLNEASANALLKMLEEPPSHLVFIMTTQDLAYVPATLRSRCHKYILCSEEPRTIADYFIGFEEGQDYPYNEMARYLDVLIEGKLSPCEIAKKFNEQSLMIGLKFIYWYLAQNVYTMLKVKKVDGFPMWRSDLFYCFKMIDKITSVQRQLIENKNINSLLILEDILIDLAKGTSNG